MEPLLALLQSSDLQRLRRVLQLMTQVHQAADGRVPWAGTEVQARFRALGEDLRGRAAGAAAAGVGRGAGVSGSSPDVAGTAAGGKEGEESDDEELDAEGSKKALHIDPAVLEARKSKQLVPECMRMLKALAISGGGKTD